MFSPRNLSILTKSYASKSFVQTAGFKKLVVTTRSQDFQKAVEVKDEELRKPAENEVLVKTLFAGVNASDINYSAGRYDQTLKPPHGIGFEAIGIIESVGENCHVKVGQPVAFFGLPARAFSEYIFSSEKEIIPVPEASPGLLNLMTTGLTATIGLDVPGRLKEGETVLITAAAGGVGHIAVQWAKAKGCHVIGTCSSDEKRAQLNQLGCDRVINYKTENLEEVLRSAYPKGIDVIWDTVGGPLTGPFINALAVKGRLIIVGAISGYKEDGTGFPSVNIPDLPLKLLPKSRTVAGFFFPDYRKHFGEYFTKLLQGYSNKELQFLYDIGEKSEGGRFTGLESVFRAVDHLHKGRNVGKVVVEL